MKNFKKYLILLSILLTLSFLIGCSSQEMKKNDASKDMEFDGYENQEENSEASPLEPEKVITTINMDFETTNFNKATEDLSLLIKKHKAYIENSEISYNSYRNNQNFKNGFYVIRVPKDEVSNFKSELNAIGNLTNESTHKEDVTKQYRDSESRLKVIEVKEERILALMTKAEKIEDIIQLENQLNEIIYEKENIKTNLINIDDQVDFTTLEFHIREVEKLSNQTSLETSFGRKIANTFKDSLYSFKKAVERFIILLIYILPFAIIIGIPTWLIFKFFKKRKNI